MSAAGQRQESVALRGTSGALVAGRTTRRNCQKAAKGPLHELPPGARQLITWSSELTSRSSRWSSVRAAGVWGGQPQLSTTPRILLEPQTKNSSLPCWQHVETRSRFLRRAALCCSASRQGSRLPTRSPPDDWLLRSGPPTFDPLSWAEEGQVSSSGQSFEASQCEPKLPPTRTATETAVSGRS